MIKTNFFRTLESLPIATKQTWDQKKKKKIGNFKKAGSPQNTNLSHPRLCIPSQEELTSTHGEDTSEES